MRRLPAVLLAAVVAATGVLVPVAAQAAAAPRLVVDRPDPLMQDPITIEVTALDAAGSAVGFRGTAVLSTGKAAVSVPMTAAADGTAEVVLPTTVLRAGWAALRLRATVQGRAVVTTLRDFAEIVPSLAVSGFGCAAVTPSGGTVRWAVDRLAGEPIRTPNSRDVPLLPYVPSSASRWTMTGDDGLPLATSGTVVIRSAAGAVVAKQVLRKQVRRLVFGTPWNGRAGGGFRPGAYTATLTLTEPSGRAVVAQQAVTAVQSGTGPCTS